MAKAQMSETKRDARDLQLRVKCKNCPSLILNCRDNGTPMTQIIHVWIFKQMFSSGYYNRKATYQHFLREKMLIFFFKGF